MMKTRLRLAFILLLISSFGDENTMVTAGVVKFSKFSKHNGFTCMDNLSLFNIIGRSSLVQCSLRCSSESSCKGVIYEPTLPRCIGCQWYTNAGPGSGLKFFNREAYRLITDNMNWVQAQINCMDLGGRLADIKSQEEQTFIEKTLLPSAVNLYWIGGKENTVFEWLDGTAVSAGYQHWYPNEPSAGEGNVDYCIMLYQRDANTTYTWSDAPCESSNWLVGSVCEFDL